jgi:signal transduction histidine kinase
VKSTIIFLGFLSTLFWFNAAKGQDIQELLSSLSNAKLPSEQYTTLTKIGLNYQNLQAYKKAIYYYDQAIQTVHTNPDIPSDTNFINKNKALCLEELEAYRAAITIWSTILNESIQKNKNNEILISREKLISLYVQNRQYQQAIEQAQILLSIAEADKNITTTASLYNKLYVFYSKVQNIEKSDYYLMRCKQLVDKPQTNINDNELCEILVNLAVTMAKQNQLVEAETYFNRALKIRKAQKKIIYQAEILNFIAALDLLNENFIFAKKNIEESIKLAQSTPDEPRAEKVLMLSYKVYGEILLRENNIKQFRIYNEKYNKLRDRLIEKEQKQNLILLEQQVEIEKKENEFRMIQASSNQNEINIKKTELEKEKKEQEIILQQKEIELLKNTRDLQLSKLLNKDLEQQKINQLLELSKQRAEANAIEKELQIAKKDKEVQQLALEKQLKENNLLEMEKKVRDQKLINELESRKFLIGLFILLTTIIAATVYIIKQQRKNNRILGERNKAIEEARSIISLQNNELKKYNQNLEKEVNARIIELKNSNDQLVRNNQQLEQFGYVVSHNLRGPIARLLGLSNILNYENIDAENKNYLESIVSTTKDLDRIIIDLNNILEIRKREGQEFEFKNLLNETNRVIGTLHYQIEEKQAHITLNIPKDLHVPVIAPYLESILYNLITNALKYSKENQIPNISISAIKKDKFAVLEVKDEGIGIDVALHKEKLFRLYSRFHFHIEGKGLGLFMIKTQTESMDGKVEVESVPDEGTTFRIHLPLERA